MLFFLSKELLKDNEMSVNTFSHFYSFLKAIALTRVADVFLVVGVSEEVNRKRLEGIVVNPATDFFMVAEFDELSRALDDIIVRVSRRFEHRSQSHLNNIDALKIYVFVIQKSQSTSTNLSNNNKNTILN